MKISRQAYAEMYGPTTGDRIRLADTALFAMVEKDFTTYGEEVKFGGGKAGSVLKSVGIEVRKQMPDGAFLELFVVVDKDWQHRADRVERLGY